MYITLALKIGIPAHCFRRRPRGPLGMTPEQYRERCKAAGIPYEDDRQPQDRKPAN